MRGMGFDRARLVMREVRRLGITRVHQENLPARLDYYSQPGPNVVPQLTFKADFAWNQEVLSLRLYDLNSRPTEYTQPTDWGVRLELLVPDDSMTICHWQLMREEDFRKQPPYRCLRCLKPGQHSDCETTPGDNLQFVDPRYGINAMAEIFVTAIITNLKDLNGVRSAT